MKDGTCGKCGDTKNIQEKHICCDGECLHDSCCAKVPENCPNKNKPIINSLGMKVLKYACCPHCEGKEMEEEDGSYTYACKNLECKCHTANSAKISSKLADKCKHLFWRDRNPPQCINCGKTEQELDKEYFDSRISEAKKEVLKDLLEMADVGEIDELRKGVTYYAQEHDIKL
jgi:hypothetical protein